MARRKLKPEDKDPGAVKSPRTEERRASVCSLYLRGHKPGDIAKELGVVPGTVIKDLHELRDRWLASSLVDFAEKKQIGLDRLEQIYQLALAAWERSCLPAEKTRKNVERVRAGRSQMVPVREIEETTLTGQVGDPRFLEQMERATLAQLKILGVYKNDSTNLNIVQIDWSGLAGKPEGVDPIEEKIKAAQALVDRRKEEWGDRPVGGEVIESTVHLTEKKPEEVVIESTEGKEVDSTKQSGE